MTPSQTTINNFLVTKLGIPNWKQLFDNPESKLKLVQEIVVNFGLNIYFQNVSASSLELSDRKIPTEEEALDLVLTTGVGGCCIHNNYVLKLILETIGFDAWIVGADMPAFPLHPQSHVLVILRLDEKLFALDVGFARPIPQLIPLHNLPYRGKTAGFSFEYIHNPETGNYERILYDGCPVFGKLKDIENGKRVDYTFNLTPRPFSYFNEYMKRLFVDADSSFMTSIMAFRLTRAQVKSESESKSDYIDFEYVNICRQTMVTGTQDSFQQTVFQSFDELKKAVENTFPNLDKQQLTMAMEKYEAYAATQEKNL